MTSRGVSHGESMKAVNARPEGGALGVGVGIALAPSTIFGGPLVLSGTGSWAIRPLLTNMTTSGLAGAAINTAFSYANSEKGYELAKSATNGFWRRYHGNALGR